MLKNYSLPKLTNADIQNKLQRIKAQKKQRLHFPTHIETKKHYQNQFEDKIVLGHLPSTMIKKERNLDISDIEGAKPKVIEKQNNIIKHYKEIDRNYEHLEDGAQRNYSILPRSSSDSKLKKSRNMYNLQRLETIPDSLDKLGSQMHKKLTINPEKNRMQTEPDNFFEGKVKPKSEMAGGLHENNSVIVPLGGRSQGYHRQPYNNSIRKSYEEYSNNQYKRNAYDLSNQPRRSNVFNPTFMSNICLL